MKSHDDLTFQLTSILKCNNSIAENEAAGAAPHIIKEAIKFL
jgi:hypothetical protein